MRTRTNVPVELPFTARAACVDPFNQVAFDVVFTDPEGVVRRVPGFWSGGKTWRVRYASPLRGTHVFRTECSDPEDAGLHGITGHITVTEYRGRNPLFRHGPVQVAANRRHFEHADHTPFFWLADTWWMGLCHRLNWPRGFRQLAADRKQKGYNVVQIVAGLYPDMHAFDPRGANEAGFPWEEGYAHIRPEYFDRADERLWYLVAQGITPCIVGAWGYFVSWMSEDQLKAHWRYLIARYGAWPVVWCTAGEANLPWYLAANFPEDDRGMVKAWTRIMRHVRNTDPFHRPVSIHPTAINRYTARNATDDETLLDFDMMQCCHAQNEAIEIMTRAVRETYQAEPRMPVLNSEPCYEMLMGTITEPWPRRAFWSCVLNGAMGHTYGGNGIWQFNQPGIPHGASPHGGNYGNTPWQEAMHFSGSTQCALGKKLLMRLPWPRFEPHPEWAVYKGDVWLALDGARWIGLSGEAPSGGGVIRRSYYRRTFNVAGDEEILSARLRFAGVGHTEARLNGAPAGVGWVWRSGPQFNDRAGLLRPGRNILTICCEHRAENGELRGLLACLEIRYAGGRVERIVTDQGWKAWGGKIGGWDSPDYDDGAWPAAIDLGGSGDQPWGLVHSLDMSLHGPQSAGIEGELRVTYVPHAGPIIQRNLGALSSWHFSRFDPATGHEEKVGPIVADADGNWCCPPPVRGDHDWIVLLERVQDPADQGG